MKPAVTGRYTDVVGLPPPPPSLYHPSLDCLYRDAADAATLGEDVQSWHEFHDMGRRPPNADGTGRYKPTAKRRHILVLGLRRDASPYPLPDLHAVAAHLGAHVGLPARAHRLVELPLEDLDGDLSVVDRDQGVAFPVKTLRAPSRKAAGAKRRRRGAATAATYTAVAAVEVFSLFDILVEYVDADAFTLVCVTNAPIFEGDHPDSLIVGRACGDRVCVVNCDPDTHWAPTAFHELLHTFGLDHWWVCASRTRCVACRGVDRR